MTGWSGTNPAEWAARQKRILEILPPAVVEAMANAMATRIGVGGYTPVDTGNLSRSVTISPSPIQQDPPGYHSPARQDYARASLAFKGDGAVFIAYKAAYARPVNYSGVGVDVLGRSYNRSGYGFHEANIARFPQIVSGVIARLKVN